MSEKTQHQEIIAKGGSDFERFIIPEDTHIGRCIRIVHLGTRDGEYQGKAKKINEVRLTFELPEVRHSYFEEEEQAAQIGKTITLSMGKSANLPKFAEAWRGKAFTEEEREEFNVSKFAGAVGLVGVKHTEKDGKQYANITGVTKVPTAMMKNVPAAENEILVVGYNEFSIEDFEKISQYERVCMSKTEEFQSGKVSKKDREKALKIIADFEAKIQAKKDGKDAPAPTKEDKPENLKFQESEDITDDLPF